MAARLPGPFGPQEQRQHLDGQVLAPAAVDPEVRSLPTLLVADVQLHLAEDVVDVQLVEGAVVDLIPDAGQLGGQLPAGIREVPVPAVHTAPGRDCLRPGGPLKPNGIRL
jgi:hypothetical protein